MTIDRPTDALEPREDPASPSERALRESVASCVGVTPDQVRVHETHISRVFVAGGRAFKFKRRVDLGFVDQRSIESRERDCREELRLNARLAPEIYLGIAALRRLGERLVLDWPESPRASGSAASPGPAPSTRVSLDLPASSTDQRIGVPTHAPCEREGAQKDGQAGAEPGLIDDWCVVMLELPEERMLDSMLEADEARRLAPKTVDADLAVPERPNSPPLVDASVASDLELLARRIARFHRDAERGPEVAALHDVPSLRRRLDQVFDGLAKSLMIDPPPCAAEMPARASQPVSLVSASATPPTPDAGHPPTAAEPGHPPAPAVPADSRPRSASWPSTLLSFLRRRSLELLESIAPSIEARRARGCVVDGHGDLHGRNICMVPGAPVAFDCLEISRELRVRDTSAEIAFLAMDLEAHGRADLAERVVEAYLDEARRDRACAERERDFRAPHQWYRLRDALVRAMVEGMRGSKESAARFLDLAVGYALPPSVVLMCGLPGSGKSTVARSLAVPLRAAVLRSDEIRKSLAGLEPTERGDASLYEPRITERVYDELMRRAVEALAAGRHVVLDAAFPSRPLRARALEALRERTIRERSVRDFARRERARRAGAPDHGSPAGEPTGATPPGADGPGPVGASTPWLLVECVASAEELERRLALRASDPSEVSDADASVMREMARRFEPPDEVDPEHRIVVRDALAAGAPCPADAPPRRKRDRGATCLDAPCRLVLERLVALADLEATDRARRGRPPAPG